MTSSASSDAHRLLHRVAEDLLGRWVEFQDHPLMVDGDDAVDRRRDNGALARLAHPDCVGDAEALDELADQRADRVGEGDQLSVRLAHLAREELDHRNAFVADAHGKGRSAPHSLAARRLGPRVARIGGVIRDPALPTGPPYACGQGELALRVELPGGFVELGQLEPGRCPRPDQAQRTAVVRLPEVAGGPSHRGSDRPEQLWRHRLERLGLRQHPRHPVLHAEPRGIHLPLGAQPGHACGERPDDRHGRHADEVLGGAERIAGEADRDRREERDHRDDGGIARARADGCDHRAHHQQLDQDGVSLDGEVERGDRAHRYEGCKEGAPLVAKSRRIGVRAQPS